MNEISDEVLREMCGPQLHPWRDETLQQIARAALDARERAEKAEKRVEELELITAEQEALIAHMSSGKTPVFDATGNPATRLASHTVAPSMAGCPTCRPTHTDLMVAPEDVPDCTEGDDE